MTPSPDPALRGFGAQVLLKHLEALENEMEGVRGGGADIEHIHRMRVATRRLRATLPLFTDCLPERKGAAWLKEIGRITRALGAARDADVQLEALEKFHAGLSDARLKTGTARLLLRLRQKRSTLQPPVVAALDHFQNSATVPNMRAALARPETPEGSPPFTDTLYLHARASIRPRLDEFLAFDAIVRFPEKVSELHAMRIAAKRLRYTIETFAPLYSNGLKRWLSAIRDAQDTLGAIHDCDVWGSLLPAFLEEEKACMLAYYGHSRLFGRVQPGVLAFQVERKAERERLYAEFVPQWEAWQAKNFWLNLAHTIQAPLIYTTELYPPQE
jgi:CHAD domain-containing protein